MDGLVTEDEEMSLASGWFGRELDQVLERLPLPHSVGTPPPRKFELRDAAIRLDIERPGRVVAGGERGTPQQLVGLK